MAEYVTKEQVIDWFRPYGHMDDTIPFETMVSDLRDMPAADVTPVVHGRWIIDDVNGKIACSDCGCIYLGYNGRLPPNYCPNCGAKMDGGDSDEVD